MSNSGILQLLEMRYLNMKYTSTNTQGYPEVTISHVKSVLFVYGGVVVFSLVLLVIEMSIYYKHQLKKRLTSKCQINQPRNHRLVTHVNKVNNFTL